MNFTVGDGFRFGCGFMLAVFLAYALLAITALIVLVLSAALGVVPTFPSGAIP